MENNHESQGRGDDVVVIELPAPHGWTKKFFPKTGGTPRKNEIVFIAPTGEEIRSKKQVDRYLKSHPGGPSASEFDWGTGDTPRRSARLTEKSKATESPKSETPKKKQRTSSSKKRAKVDDDDDDDEDDDAEAPENKEDATEDTKDSAAVSMEGTKDPEDHVEAEVVEGEAPGDKDPIEESEKKDNVEVVVTEEAPISDETKVNIDEMGMDELDNKKTSHETYDTNEEKVDNESLPDQGLEEHNNEAGNEPGEDETPSKLSVPIEAVVPGQEVKAVKYAVPVVADAKLEKGSEDAEGGQAEDHPDKETPDAEVANAEAASQPEENERQKGNQEAENPKENHSPSSMEAPREPRVPQVSC